MNRHPAGGREKPTIEFKGATHTFIPSTHETNREISHVERIGRIVSLAGRGGSSRRQEPIAERA
jgi:hypothetical protein